MKRILALVIAVLCMAMPLTACGNNNTQTPGTTSGTSQEEVKPVDVRIAIHGNVGGAVLAGVAVEQGFFKEEGINPIVTIVESGPSEMAAMRADNRTLDIGYIGAGVAWNAMDPNGNQLKFVLLDCLSNSEFLIARKGMFTDTNNNGIYDYDEIYNSLKGKTVYIDTATTPGGWFKDLLNTIHTELGTAPADQLWIYSETADYVKGYEAPNNNPANKITVVQLANENMPAAMSTSDASRADIAVGYAPVPGIIVENNKDIEIVAATDTHMPTKYFPSTWVASQKWLEESPEVAQRVINALVKAVKWRGDAANEAASLAAGEKLAQKPEGSFERAAVVWPGADEYNTWFASSDSKGYGYMKVLYEAKKGGVPEGTTPKAFEDCIDFSFLLNALK